MISVIIVEDRPLARNELKHLLSLHPDVEVLGEFEDTAGAEPVIIEQAGQIDAIFLDIDIENEGERAGLGLAYRIDRLALPRKLRLVFATGFKDYIADAIEVRPFGYLLKPLKDTDVTHVLEKIRKDMAFIKPPDPLPEPILIKHRATVDGDKIQCARNVYPAEILFIQSHSDGRTVNVHLVNGEQLQGVYRALNKWQEPNFIQVHRSYVANFSHVNGYKTARFREEGVNATFRGSDKEIPVGRTYEDKFFKSFLFD